MIHYTDRNLEALTQCLRALDRMRECGEGGWQRFDDERRVRRIVVALTSFALAARDYERPPREA